jgi:hypothetical protein
MPDKITGWAVDCGCYIVLKEVGDGHEVTGVKKQCEAHKGLLPQHLFEACLEASKQAQGLE